MTKINYITLLLLILSLNSLFSDEIKHDLFNRNIKIYELPDTLTFAGKIIPLNYLDVKDRLEEIFNILVHDRRGMINNLLHRYEYFIPNAMDVLNSYGIHEDYAFIIAAESGMKERIGSSKNASGPWQFIKRSAVSQGLRVDDTVDERNIIKESTNAASLHIQELLGTTTCNGDPFLTLAAYNNGLTNVRKTLDSQGVESFWDAVTNKETSDYVCRVIIYKEILQNYNKYGFVNYHDNNPESFNNYRDDLELFYLSLDDKKISLKEIARFIGISYREFYLTNPQLKHKSYKKTEYIDKYSVLNIFIPAKSGARLLDSLYSKNYYKNKPNNNKNNEILKGTNKNLHSNNIIGNNKIILYTVNDEKSLGEIAFRHRTSIEKIIELNEDIKFKKNEFGLKVPVIEKGQEIRIYVR